MKKKSSYSKMEKFCTNCGQQFINDQKFCTNCGNKREHFQNANTLISNDQETNSSKDFIPLSEILDNIKSYLTSITDSNKGDIYDYNYWFDQVQVRVDSHDLYYYDFELNSLNDQVANAKSHYDEYHFRMIEELNDNKVEFITPRIICFLEVYNQIVSIDNTTIFEKDFKLLEKFLFHSKTSLYGAVIFLYNDVEKGELILNKIFPDFDHSFLNTNSNDKFSSDKSVIEKSIELLNPKIRNHFNHDLKEKSYQFVEKRNTSSFNSLMNMIDSMFPLDRSFKIEESKNLTFDDLNNDTIVFMGRIFSALYTFVEINEWYKYLDYITRLIKKYKIKIDDNIGIVDVSNEIIDNNDWEKNLINENFYILTKKNDEGTIIHQKFFENGELDSIDLDKESKKSTNEIIQSTIQLIKFCNGDENSFQEDELPEHLKNPEVVEFLTLKSFWRIFNSFDNKSNIPWELFNEMSYFFYSKQMYNEGIYTANLSIESNENSRCIDTLGEGYFELEHYSKAFSCFKNAVDIDEENGKYDIYHLLNYIKSSIAISNVISTQRGILLLKKHFPNSDKLDDLEKQLNDLISKSDIFKCPRCNYIPKRSQKFCVKCGEKFDLNENNDFDVLSSIKYLLSKSNTKSIYDFAIKIYQGEMISEKKMDKLIDDLIKVLIEENETLIKSTNEDQKSIFLGVYINLIVDPDILIMSNTLTEFEDDKFEGWHELEQIYSIYLLVRKHILKKSLGS